MKKYVKAWYVGEPDVNELLHKAYQKQDTAHNGNAVAIAEEVFYKGFRQNPQIKIFKQSRGYALKYYARSEVEANNILGSMYEVADELQIPILDSKKKIGYLGSTSYIVVYIIVPAT